MPHESIVIASTFCVFATLPHLGVFALEVLAGSTSYADEHAAFFHILWLKSKVDRIG